MRVVGGNIRRLKKKNRLKVVCCLILPLEALTLSGKGFKGRSERKRTKRLPVDVGTAKLEEGKCRRSCRMKSRGGGGGGKRVKKL